MQKIRKVFFTSCAKGGIKISRQGREGARLWLKKKREKSQKIRSERSGEN